MVTVRCKWGVVKKQDWKVGPYLSYLPTWAALKIHYQQQNFTKEFSVKDLRRLLLYKTSVSVLFVDIGFVCCSACCDLLTSFNAWPGFCCMKLINVASTDRPLAFGDCFAPWTKSIVLLLSCQSVFTSGWTKLIYEIMIISRLRQLLGFISGRDNVPPTPALSGLGANGLDVDSCTSSTERKRLAELLFLGCSGRLKVMN